MKNIVVVGSINTDLVFRTSKLPLPGETVLAGEFNVVQGGKGANQAIAIARSGSNPVFVAKLGTDDYGKNYRAFLENQKISTNLIFSEESASSGIAVIMVDEKTAQNSILVAPGANNHLSVEDIRKVEHLMPTASILLAQLEIPLDTVYFSLEIAKKYGVKTILNPAPAKKMSRSMLNMVDIITPNETEAELLTGISLDKNENIINAARKLIQEVNEAVIITLGSQGAFFMEKDGLSGFVQSQQVEAVDTTAAGDVFNGYLASALANGANTRQAIELANKAAAISVTRKGAQPSIPFISELRFYYSNLVN